MSPWNGQMRSPDDLLKSTRSKSTLCCRAGIIDGFQTVRDSQWEEVPVFWVHWCMTQADNRKASAVWSSRNLTATTLRMTHFCWKLTVLPNYNNCKKTLCSSQPASSSKWWSEGGSVNVVARKFQLVLGASIFGSSSHDMVSHSKKSCRIKTKWWNELSPKTRMHNMLAVPRKAPFAALLSSSSAAQSGRQYDP